MKRIFLLAVFASVFAFTSVAQESPISKGQAQLNFGAGFSNWGLPLYFGLDYGVHPDISIGGELSYRSWDENWGNGKYHHNVIGISGNGNYHFNRILNIPSNWDFYAGLNIGFVVVNSDSGYEGDHTSGLGLGAQVGGRYYWSDRWGINLEFGGGNAFSGGKIGLSVKL